MADTSSAGAAPDKAASPAARDCRSEAVANVDARYAVCWKPANLRAPSPIQRFRRWLNTRYERRGAL